MSEEIKQISRDQAARMANIVISHALDSKSKEEYERLVCKFIDAWETCEMIEKSELEIAAELYEKPYNPIKIDPVITNYVDLLKSELEKKNKEIQELRK